LSEPQGGNRSSLR